MARLSRTNHQEAESEDDNIIVAGPKPSMTAQSQRAISPSTGTRIPETPVLANAPAATHPHPPRHAPERRATVTEVDRLRIRNAIQREEIRTKARELRRSQQEADRLQSETAAYRSDIESYRHSLRETRVWMEVSWFCALVMFVCIVLYVLWCWVNRAEFELQEKIVRRNLGLK